MKDITIREARMEDLQTLLLFEQGVIAAERPFDPTLRPETYYYDLPLMIQAGHIHLLVAEWMGRLISCGYARIENAQHFLKHAQYAYLGFMYTVPEHRGRGINRMIIEALQEWTISRGITELRLEVYHPNTAAIQAYEKAGFSKHMLEMRKGLDP